MYAPSQVKAAGLTEPKVLWHGSMPAGLGPAYLDPKGDKITAESKTYFEYNPEKAKALLAEAGYPDGISADYHYTPFYGAQWQLQCELIPQMAAKAGIKLNSKIDDFNAVYNTKTFLGDFDGVANLYQGFATVEDYLLAMYDPASGRNQGKINDPKVTDATNKMLQDFNADSRRKTGLEVQQYLIDQMYYVPHVYNAGPNYTAYQPRLQGVEYGTARSGGGFNQAVHLWIKS
jgi:peptide/nickel transport system substrate-binding protein